MTFSIVNLQPKQWTVLRTFRVSLFSYSDNLLNSCRPCRIMKLCDKGFFSRHVALLSLLRSPHFMAHDCSLPLSQQPPTCPYTEPDWFSPCPHPTPWRFISILSSHLRLGLPSVLLPSGFPHNNHIYSSPLPLVLHARSISFFSIWSPE